MGGRSYDEAELEAEYQSEKDRQDWIDALHMTAASSDRYPWDEENLLRAAQMFYRLIKQGPPK